MEEGDHRIRRANLDGTNIQEVVTGVDEPEDIAIDVSEGMIYWTEAGDRRIQRANLDGSDAHVIVPDLDGAPRGIALDIAGDGIYWADYSNNEIWRANLDGTNAHVVAIGVSSPTAIAIHDSTMNIRATTTTATTDAAIRISPASVAIAYYRATDRVSVLTSRMVKQSQVIRQPCSLIELFSATSQVPMVIICLPARSLCSRKWRAIL